MGMRIVFKADDGSASVVIPTDEALSLFPLMEIAYKSVPEGKPFKILDVEELPLHLDENGEPIRDEEGLAKQDRTFRDAWEVDEALLTDGVGRGGLYEMEPKQ